MRRTGLLAIAAAAVVVTGLQIAPAHADDWYGWRQHQQREQAWRQNERREEWREPHRWYPAYSNYGYYRFYR